jgi:hypothetical protein
MRPGGRSELSEGRSPQGRSANLRSSITTLSSALLINLVFLGLGLSFQLLSWLVGLQTEFAKYMAIAWVAAFVGCVASIAGLYLRDTTKGYVRAKKDLEEQYQELELLERISPIHRDLRFIKRTDRFVILGKGDVRLEWSFKLGPTKQTRVYLPIFAENHEEASCVGVDSITVKAGNMSWTDPHPQQHYQPVHIRKPFPGVKGPQMEFGILTVDLSADDLSPSERTVYEICAKMTLRGAFPMMLVHERAIVDLPYFTDELEIVIEGANGVCSVGRPDGVDPLEVSATWGNIEVGDGFESLREKHRYQESGGSIKWPCSEPKAGYRYAVSFRVADAKWSAPSATVPIDDASAT